MESLVEALPRCDFIAFDGEFSGLYTANWRNGNMLDTFSTRYSHLQDAATNFTILQYGVCLFFWDDNEAAYVAQPYNFFLSPKGFEGLVERNFTVQASSFDFLASHNFDFNASFARGLPYLSHAEEKEIKQNRALREQIQQQRGEITISKQEDKDYIESVQQKLQQFMADQPAPDTYMVLDAVNGFLRRLVYQEVPKMRDDIAIDNNDEDNQEAIANSSFLRRLRLTFLGSKEARDRKEEEKQKERDKERDADLQEAIGFRRVMDAISASQKPIIGHNCMTDLVYTYQRFIAPLPPSLDKFTASIHSWFPVLFDTKLMISLSSVLSKKIPGSALGDAFRFTNKEAVNQDGSPVPLVPKINYDFTNGFNRYVDSNDFQHEAAFDAYMTGALFVRLVWMLGRDRSHIANLHTTLAAPSSEQMSAATTEDVPMDTESSSAEDPLTQLVNRVPAYGMVPSYFDFVHPNQDPSRDHVLLLSGFNPGVQTSDVNTWIHALLSVPTATTATTATVTATSTATASPADTKPAAPLKLLQSVVWLNELNVFLAFIDQVTAERAFESIQDAQRNSQVPDKFVGATVHRFSTYVDLCSTGKLLCKSRVSSEHIMSPSPAQVVASRGTKRALADVNDSSNDVNTPAKRVQHEIPSQEASK